MTVSYSKKGFGKDLGAILGTIDAQSNGTTTSQQSLKQVMAHQLSPGKYQPRREFDPIALKELSSSIASQGILQPIVARESGNNEYEIIAGKRRWRAAQMAGLQQIPIIICDVSDESALAFGLIENIQRQDLNHIEESIALKRIIEEFSMTHEQVGQSIGRSRASVSNTLRLLNLSKPVQQLLVDKVLDIGHAKLLLVFPADEQEVLAGSIINKKMTVRAAEKFIQSQRDGSSGRRNQNRTHQNCSEWSRTLSHKLSMKADVKVLFSGEGKITLHVNSVDDIERLIDNL